MSRYFRISTFSSFVRQLNMYNFKKVKNGGKGAEFYHPNFIKGRIDDLKHIKRKTIIAKGSRRLKAIFSQEPNKITEVLQQQIRELTEKNKIFSEINSRIINQIRSKNQQHLLELKKLLMVFLMTVQVDDSINKDLKDILKCYNLIEDTNKPTVIDLANRIYTSPAIQNNPNYSFINEMLRTVLKRVKDDVSANLDVRINDILENGTLNHTTKEQTAMEKRGNQYIPNNSHDSVKHVNLDKDKIEDICNVSQVNTKDILKSNNDMFALSMDLCCLEEQESYELSSISDMEDIIMP